MTTIDVNQSAPERPYQQPHVHAPHWRSGTEEFDAAKIGMWLFLTTEVLLFAGMFCAYAVYRMQYPQAFSNGSHYLNWVYGASNTLILLVSSFTVAMSIHNAQKNQRFWLQLNLFLTALCGVAFLCIKFMFEYRVKWADGKRPGEWFTYPFASDPHEPVWWSIYYVATGIHATHVLIGVGLLLWLWMRARKAHFGSEYYTPVEIVGLYWHIVDIVWIFLFPLLYLIH